MSNHTTAYAALVKGIATRKRTLLREPAGKLIVPRSGTVWFPSAREQSLCESYVVLVAAEIEAYLEAVALRAIDAYLNGHKASFLVRCGASEDFCNQVAKKRRKWEANNNTSWARVSDTFTFIGLSRDMFPNDLWGEIDAITVERGSIVHESVGVRNVNDPRQVVGSIERFLTALRTFDERFETWISALEAEVARMSTNPIRFLVDETA